MSGRVRRRLARLIDLSEIPTVLATEEAVRRGTRWSRSALVLTPALLLTGVFAVAVTTGVLATQVNVQSGTDGILATSSLYGTDFGLVLGSEQYTKADGTTATRNTLRMAFAHGQINGLCIAQPQTIGPFAVTLILTASDNNPGTWEIKADNIVIDLTQAKGRLNLNGVVGTTGFTNPEVLIGADSSAITVGTPPLTGWGGTGLGGRFGWWGIKAGVAKFGPVTANVEELSILGALQLPNLSLTVAPKGTTCPAPALPSGAPS
ncbi:MAG: hypothetical protein HOV83_21865 [Catenulispora sp.]|nr:hypothetical protein [Catenulispora sp.]